MSSLQSVVASLQVLQSQNYIIIAGMAGVCYDYFLTLGREVNLIWGKSWSIMSTLYVVVRLICF
ncbi:hypothetical protein HYDPIDRAFT_111480 [Hydnomerulius pinastri MD-312]|uniref:DUF6533 domain-containing protein n=1 Tax=Hydnomerulius pinastri MD-312 TaxID=994086 RepID=A0A0C9WAA0_9AGAM|nr:hypothetical protein HYDPIDRAFT_111480 [Hydnomerulius pinastri MD-312]